MKHDYSKGQMVGLAIAFMILPIFFYALRIWAKLLVKRFTLDDYVAGAALLVSNTCCALQLATAFHGHLGQHQPLNADGSPIMDDPGLIFFEQTKFALNMISVLGLGLIKTSILVLYLSLFPNRKFRWCVYGALVYVICWTISYFFSHLFTCFPITVFIEPYYHNSCVDTVPMFLSLLYTDVIADFAILVLPIPMVMGLQMRMQKKMAVLVMLGLGAAVCAVSVTRVVATYSIAAEYINHPNDVIYYTAPVFFWTNIELSLAVVCACLPTLRPIWKYLFPKPVTTGTDSYEYRYGSGRRTGGHKATANTLPYEELDEMELHDARETGSGALARRDIVKQTTIQQTIESSDSSSTTNLRPAEFSAWPLGRKRDV
ncbi:hypothetical protein BGZ61DRAFT_464724 [Ilyonectria robusta]|uniref:uncharacterized protein n=1 Tax=Ilyonectria robusta TaxID=1079257 RepID=UPI001E8D89A5|nr:uncharacterized protein BGZ61DRAFT_464724 [Ilyonectria robusta]KAH8661084.1 hypothetical protein BGZ61DRAFT_464724 [Ilyonectria robusta]